MMKFYTALEDKEIERLAKASLWLYPFIDPSGMKIEVRDAVVTITGCDLNPDDVQRATALLADFTCVRQVRDCTWRSGQAA
ncbi:BON domain-containing protein [Devosia sp. RR2S18]|uniref:BON domain-containing protein n=1 Tax=Devosia rhizosphaerae TaxID=3049774 RepID=UPI002540FD1A|nr:BON domain-containing protein [Devosia sp. RR2S18]WIJ26967.1 BON domain-containing protein [Devosia sp. RR2S18]